MAWNRFGKFNAQKVREDGYLFDSKMENKRYGQLKLLLAAKSISDLEIHPKLEIIINGVKIGYYEADFLYIENGKPVYEDTKGFENDLFKLKYKVIKALYPTIDLRILKKS